MSANQTSVHPVIIISVLKWPCKANYKNITCSCVSISKSTAKTSHIHRQVIMKE